MPKITESFRRIWSVLAVGPTYLAISATVPSTILWCPLRPLPLGGDALDLMVPLLKRHFGLPRSGITIKVLILGYPSSAQLLACWGGNQHLCQPEGDLQTTRQVYLVPTPPSLEGNFPVIHLGHAASHKGPLNHPGVTPWRCSPLPPCFLHMESPKNIPELIKVKFPNILGQVQLGLIIGVGLTRGRSGLHLFPLGWHWSTRGVFRE